MLSDRCGSAAGSRGHYRHRYRRKAQEEDRRPYHGRIHRGYQGRCRSQTLQDAEVSVVTITYEKASTQCEVQCTSGLIQSITAEYDGETSAGTQISDTNPGIHVYAIRDGNKTPVESGWRVANPSVLEKEKITTVNIEYEGFSCALSIQCTTREIVRLTASYKGSTEEGTVISTGCKDLTVTAKYADRTSEEVDKWTLAESVTLEPKERYILEIHYEDSVCTLEVTCTTPTPEEFKAGCISASYSSLYRNPAKYTGTNVVVEGTTVRHLYQDTSRPAPSGGSSGQNIRHVQGSERPNDGRLLHDHAGDECGICRQTLTSQHSVRESFHSV